MQKISHLIIVSFPEYSPSKEDIVQRKGGFAPGAFQQQKKRIMEKYEERGSL